MQGQAQVEALNNLSILYYIYGMARGVFSTSHLAHFQIYSLAQDLS
jgi:hypothetical protein